jgi:hypothetical protein
MMPKNNRSGYAIVVVLVLLVIGTVTLVMFNRESMFFTKVSGFFSRTKKIQNEAQTGIDLARADLRKLALNSRQIDTSSLDTFTSLNGDSTNAFNKGLYADYQNANLVRELTPRISRSSGNIDLAVFYFPENPCLDLPCTSEAAYNQKLPKRFIIVSQATNRDSGEVFTIENRIQIRLENFAEISFGVLGAGPYPPTNQDYRFAPSIYGRSHWDLPADQLNFILGLSGAPLESRTEQHIFTDLATFQRTTPSDQDYPFRREQHSATQLGTDGNWYLVSGMTKEPMMNFKKGMQEDVKLYNNDPNSSDYIEAYDPTSNAYFDQLRSMSLSSGQDLSNAEPCPSNGKPIDVCLKFDGSNIKRYNCNYIDPVNRTMGRIDENIHPQFRNLRYYTSPSGGIADSNGTTVFNGSSDSSNSAANWPDRYAGERSDVYTGATDNSIATYPTGGVIFCKPNDCKCNIHFKGVIDGQVTLAADYATIEGDTVYSNQDRVNSNDVLGIVAKEDIIIPQGIPQAASTLGQLPTHNQEPRSLQAADNAPPFSTQSTSPHMPATLAESYLGITNFIARSGGQYLDRDFNDADYKEYATWIPEVSEGVIDPSDTNYYNSPMVLDLDGFMFAGNAFKVDGIFNPNDIGQGSTNARGMGVLTCENATTLAACTSYKYRDPLLNDGSSNALYNADGSLASMGPPLFWNDGKAIGANWDNNTSRLISSCGNAPPQNCSGTAADNFKNVGYQAGEETARPLNHLIKIFGGINSKFSLIGDETHGNFKNGFKRRIVEADPRASYMFPPGYPSSLNIRMDELYQKTYNGTSPLLTTP